MFIWIFGHLFDMFRISLAKWSQETCSVNCKICPIGNNDDLACLYCWQWANFTMGPNEQNQHIGELRQKVCFYIHAVVLLKGMPSLDDINKLFVGKKAEKWLAQLKSDRLKQLVYGAPFVTSILLLTEATFLKTKVTFVGQKYFCLDKSCFCQQK